ncbi:MAG: matrixin family metalloprotease [Myxococcota bacterium]
MTRKSSFAAISGLLLLACAPESERGFIEIEPHRASFAHDLRTSDADGGPARSITPWPAGEITFAFLGETPGLDVYRFREEARAGLLEWQKATSRRVVFTEMEDPLQASVLISFRPGDHQGDRDCGDQFTNPAETVAHVFTYDQDCQAGVIHLNQDLDWVMNGSGAPGTYDVRYVILHEVGHLLGLPHHLEPGHIMHTDYMGAVRTLTEEEGQDAVAALGET